ncbi:MAG: hypothetical protein EBY09_05175 [Verrucomicrobia bacterium]|nr:hypothetical protein [Verrucomicrobiota bacterium]NDD38010.1 hypothetical protein [Verrucomicrobiota bacterium]
MPTREEFHKRWLALLLTVDLPMRALVRRHIEAATRITLCECGCHSFDLHFSEGLILPPLTEKSGLFCEFSYETNHEFELDFLLICDQRGYLASVDVIYSIANITPIPDDIEVRGLKGIWLSG